MIKSFYKNLCKGILLLVLTASCNKVPQESVKKPLRGIFVDKFSDGAIEDGKSWGSAFKTIAQGIESALENGQNIYVAAGIYYEHIDLTNKKNIHLIGGYKITEEFEKEPLYWGRTILNGSKLTTDALVLIAGNSRDIEFRNFTFEHVKNGSAIKIAGMHDNKVRNITIANSRISFNSNMRANGQGAGISIVNAQGIELNRLHTAKNLSADAGGSIYVSGVDDLNLYDVDFAYCESQEGGGLWIADSQNITMSEVVFTSNVSKTFGGGLLARNVTNLKINNGIFTGNKAMTDMGGGFAGESLKGKFELVDVKLNGNSAKSGGGLYIPESSAAVKIVISNSQFIKNVANHGDGGGALLSASSKNELSELLFMGNKAKERGGALFFVGDDENKLTKIDIPKSQFLDNESGQQGGIE